VMAIVLIPPLSVLGFADTGSDSSVGTIGSVFLLSREDRKSVNKETEVRE